MDELLSTLEIIEQIQEFFKNSMRQALQWNDKEHALKSIELIVGDMLDRTIEKLKKCETGSQPAEKK